VRRKAQGKTKYIKGIVTHGSIDKDLAWDWILVKGLHEHSGIFLKLDTEALQHYYSATSLP